MLKKKLFIFNILVLVILVFLGCVAKNSTQDFDIMIINGRIVDGTGNPWYYSDIGIKDDIITDIGNLSKKKAATIIDAKGLIIAPGFIDLHTHCDWGLGVPSANVNLNYLKQGTTTVVTGNCGTGTIKITEIKKKWERHGIGTNAIHVVGFGAIRKEVLGLEPRAPSTTELEKMKALLRQAMQEGAWGMSVGLEYIPDMYSSTEEIIALAKIAAEFNGVYLAHQRDEDSNVPDATRETIQIAKEAQIRANVAHFKVIGKENWGSMEEAVDVINNARENGLYITADMYPYDKASVGPIISIESNSGWSLFRLPDDMEPFAEIRKKINSPNTSKIDKNKLQDRYIEELAKALKDKSKYKEIRESVLKGEPDDPSPIKLAGWSAYAVVDAQKSHHLIGKILSDIADEQKRDPFDIVADLAIEEPNIQLSAGALSEVEMKYLMKQNWLMFSSDGIAVPIIKASANPLKGHPRSFGSQARVIRKYVREEKTLILEDAIRKMSSLPSQLLQLKKRGLLFKGYKADIVLFDPNEIQDVATYADSQKYSRGIKYVLVNGRICIDNGDYNNNINGKLLLLNKDH